MKTNRDGSVCFGDASLSVWEEGLSSRMTYTERQLWEEKFKTEVFRRMVWMLRKLGWETQIDPEQFADCKKRHGLKFAQRYCSNSRLCSHGDLKGHISVSGRHIEFKTWQGVNTPTRSDHGGRYESDLEKVMPYAIRLRMERTRRKIRDYLIHLFDGYSFKDRSPKATKVGISGLTAIQSIQQSIRDSGHYRPELGHAQIHTKTYRFSADGVELEHGKTRAYSFDYRGRPMVGTVYYSLNGNWIIHTGKHDHYYKWHNEIHVTPPSDLRIKRNKRQRRSRLEGELAKAIKAMDFMRANTLKGILFPTDDELYVVKHPDGCYHRSNFSGYTNNVIDAGKFTMAEVRGYAKDNEIIPLSKAS